MRFTVCLLNLLLLWTFATGQNLCLCSDRDACHGIASMAASVVAAAVAPENSPLEFSSVLSSGEQSDCCSDCFITLESIGSISGATEYLELSDFQLLLSSLLDYIRATNSIELSRYDFGPAPPLLCSSGSKIYLAKRTLLI